MSCWGLGIIFEGVKRLRAVESSIPEVLARMVRKSWKVRPGEIWRIFCLACQSVTSLPSIMRLRTPSCSINAITCCCAPAPMESMETTAATPKIMPSMVRKVRILCTTKRVQTLAEFRQNIPPTLRSTRRCRGGWGDKGGRSAHLPPPPTVGDAAVEAFSACSSGFTKATSVPAASPSIATRVSDRCVIFIFCAAKSLPLRT